MKKAVKAVLVFVVGISFLTIISVYAGEEVSDQFIVRNSAVRDFRWDLEKKDVAEARKSPITSVELQSLVQEISAQSSDVKKLSVLGDFIYLWSRRTMKFQQTQMILEKIHSEQAKADATLMLRQINETGAGLMESAEVHLATNTGATVPIL